MLGGMDGVGHIASVYRTLRNERPRDRSVGRVAAGQHTVISLEQLRALGLTASAVRSRVASGRLYPVHRGVYAVGHARLTLRGRWMAAVLAYGPKAVLSHRSAAALWGLRQDSRAETDVTVPSRSARSRPGIDVHRSLSLAPADRTVKDGIPCTTLARTLLDLAEVVNRRGLERAIEQAELLRLFDLRAVDEVLARADGRRGASVLRSVLGALEEPALTASDLEERFLALCRAAGLRRPEVNVWLVIDELPPVKADFLWRAERLVVETDGWESHCTRRAFEYDRRRDERLKLAGYESLRFTWRRIINEPVAVMRTVSELLARRAVAR
jgi:very-short-patch-repair endonuclease/predicted transcriptional regulator of viral defense system